MSTTGDCVPCIIASSPLQGAAVAGVLVQQGIVQTVEYLKKIVDKPEQAWKKAYDDALASSNANKSKLKGAFMRQTMHAAEERGARAHDPTQKIMDPRTLQQRVEQVRASLADAGALVAALNDAERQAARQELQLAIAAGRARLPQHLLQKAERSLVGSVREMQEATRMLEEARREVDSALPEQERLRQQIDHQLQVATSQLYYINQMLDQAESAQLPEFAERSARVTRLIAVARSGLYDDLDKASKFAAEAQQVAQTQLERASEYLLDGWSNVQGEVNTLIGKLSMLKQMAEEADATRMSGHERLQDLIRRITATYHEAQAIGQQSSLSGHLHLQLSSLTERAEAFKDELFALLQAFQQRTIAEAIATTLKDLGFQAISGGQPAIEENGEMIRVTVVKPGNNTQSRPDNKLVEFDISKEGKVSYDFSGYLADDCIVEAERIFAALRARGIYLLEPEISAKLQADYPNGLTRHVVERAQFYPHPIRNKVQTELAQRLQQVLRRMQFENVLVRTIAGSIELDAFNGSIGYHVILEPEGTVQVFKDAGYTDVSSDSFDPIVAESQMLTELGEISASDSEQAGDRPQKQRQRPFVDERRKRVQENSK